MILRETTKKKLQTILDGTYLTASCFSVAYGGTDENIVQINFIPKPDMSFLIRKHKNDASKFITLEAPSNHVTTAEIFIRDKLDDCFSAIRPWAARIIEDYKSQNPFFDELEQFKKQMADKFNEHVGDSTAHFTETEITALEQKLDSLSQKLEEITVRNEENEAKLDAALKEIQQVKSDLSQLPKEVWYRVAGTKVINAIRNVSNSGEGRTLMLDVAKKYLIGGPSD